MQGHGTLFLCDACGRAFPDQSSKEILYQVDKVRYRQELCPTCLDAEIRRHDGRRGIPGFRKRAATVVKIASSDDLPRTSGPASPWTVRYPEACALFPGCGAQVA